MSVCCECCVLSGRGLCDELFIRTWEPYRPRCVVCDLETSEMRRPWPAAAQGDSKFNNPAMKAYGGVKVRLIAFQMSA
jgi:hypothetical protein